MGWAKRLWARLGPQDGLADASAVSSWKRLDPTLAGKLGTLGGCLDLAGRLDKEHRRAARGLRAEDREVQELVLAAAKGSTHQDLALLFELVDGEASRALLAQGILALYGWDPLAVVFTTQDFDEGLAEARAVGGLIEDLSRATGEGVDRIRARLPGRLSLRMASLSLLETLHRPLGLLTPSYRVGTGGPGTTRFDGALLERDVERGLPTGRGVVLQVEPFPTEAQREVKPGFTLLRFTRDEVLASFDAGSRIAAHVGEAWGWRALGEPDDDAVDGDEGAGR